MAIWLLRVLTAAMVLAAGTEAQAEEVPVAPRRGDKAEKGMTRDAVLAPPATFIPITPCRVADTRQGEGKTGAFGPPSLAATTVRTFPIPLSTCGVPTGASAYSLNITAIPKGPLSFLTVYPTGQTRPNVSTLNSFNGEVIANAALVPAGFNGAIDVYVNDAADVVIDINGYLGTGEQALRFYTIAPCRVMDTRNEGGKAGSFGPPSLAGGSTREVPVPSSGCPVPASARGYVMNVTVIPRGPLPYLTVWPTGQPQPLASTLNSFGGKIVANAAIIPAGTAGAISIFATSATDVVLDVAGYLAP